MAGGLAVDTINGHNIAGGFLGIGQTWQDVTASRSAGVTYTNSTGKPIEVSITTNNSGNTGFNSISINGVISMWLYGVQPYNNTTASFTVPNGFTYQFNATMTGVAKWSELR